MSSPETWCVPVSDYESPTSLSSIGTTVVSVSFLLHCVVLGMLVHMWRSMGVKVLDSLSVRRLGARSIGLRASAASAAAPAQPAEPADALPQRLSKDSVQFASLRMTGTAFDMAVVLGCVMLHVFAAMQYPSVTTASCRTRPFFLVAGVALIMGASLLRLFWIDSLDARGYSKPGLSWSVSRPEPDSARTAPSDGSHRSGPPSLVQSSSANGGEFWSGFKVVEAFKWYNRHERRLVKHLGLGTLAALVVPALWATMDGMVTEPVTVLRAGGEEAVRYEQCVSRSATWLGILTFAMLVGGVVLTIKAYKLLRNPAPVNTSLRMLVTLLLTLVVAMAAVSQRAYFDGQPDGKFMGFVIFACAVCWVITGSLAVSRLIRFYLPHSSVGRALEAAYFPSVRQQQREFFFMQLMRGQNALRRRGAAMRQAASAFDDLNESMGAAQPVGASGINIHMLSPSPYTDSQALAELRALALLRDENEMLREKITQLEMTVVELVPGSVSISIDTSGTSSSPAAAGELVPPAGEQQRNSDSLSSLEEEPPYRTDSAGSISSMFGRHGSFERSRSISASSAAYSTLPLAATGSSKMPSNKPVFVRAKSAPAPGAHVSGFVATPAAGPRSPSSGARDRDRIQRTATPILPSPDATVRRLSHRRSLSSRRNSRNLHEQQLAAKDDQIARLQRQLRDLQRGDEDERPSDSSGSSGPTRWGQPQG